MMGNQGWPTERCAAPRCGLRAKMNMGAGAGAPLYIRLRPCGRCKELRYCNRECQMKHWKAGHKDECVIPGDKPAPPMAEELRAAVSSQIANRGCYILAHAPGHSEENPLGPEDKISIHTIGFHEHGAPELHVGGLPHRLLQRAGGALAFVRNEKPLDAPLQNDERITVNGLTFRAERVRGESLSRANSDTVVSVRAFYHLKKSDPLVEIIVLELEKEETMPPEMVDAVERPKDGGGEADPTKIAEQRAQAAQDAQNAKAKAATTA